MTGRLGLLAGGLAVGLLAACGSSDADSDAAAEAAPDVTEAAPETTVEDVTTDSAAAEVAVDDGTVVDECDYSTFIYTPFTEIPAEWPSVFPVPTDLEEIDGEIGMGCEGRVTIDMRSRHYGASRDWVAEYGDQLSAAGFEFDDEYDELNQLSRTYRSGEDWISFGGPIELEGSDREYITVGLVLTDFPD